MQIPLPLERGKIQLMRSSPDELVVHIGNRKRILSLPHTLASMQIERAHHEDSMLYIDFHWAKEADTDRPTERRQT